MHTLSGIRRGILLKTSFLVLLLILGFLLASDQIILNYFRSLEQKLGMAEINRINNVIHEEVSALKKMLTNEAQWDAAYKFILDDNAEFIESDMMGLHDLDIDFTLYLDLDGNIVAGKQRNSARSAEEEISPVLTDVIITTRKAWSHTSPASHTEGVLMIEGKPLLIASQPILTSDGSGPLRGSLLIGRWIDSHWLDHLSETIDYPITLNAPPPGGHPPQALSLEVDKNGPENLKGTIPLNDIFAKPALTLTTTIPRDIYLSGKKSIYIFSGWFLIGILVSAILVYIYINKWITARIESKKQLKHLVYHDRLTNLPNRIFIQEFVQKTLSAARREKKSAALLFIDLDRFTQFNETYGHIEADKLLIAVAQWFSDRLRESDVVARIAGDMFAIFLPAIHDRDEVKLVAHKLLEIKNHPFELGSNEVFVSCSIGISLFPDDGDNFGSLLKLADMAMHEAKRAGRNTYHTSSEEMNQRVAEQNYLEASLIRALQLNELSLAFQPQYDMTNKQLVCVEALLRWTHPERGNIPPSIFIPIAEKTGLIYDLGHWVLNAVCMQIKKWEESSSTPPRVAVNFSGLEITSPGFIEKIENTLERTGVKPSQIEIELTESILMESVENIHLILNQLRSCGFQIAIDDFGTGYSSLSYLRHFPIQKIKIDKSFISGISKNAEDIAIVDAIVTIAKSLEMEVIAEGVENGEQLEILLSRGCTGMQGYFFAHPMRAAQIDNFCPFKHNLALCTLEQKSPDRPGDFQPT